MKILKVSRLLAVISGCAVFTTSGICGEIHVATTGNDSNDGSESKPLRTIQAAAGKAQPGDTVTVHAGTYRERVDPPRGGESETKRITYQAAPGEKVVLTGAETVKGWENVSGDVWKKVVPGAFFGKFNPFAEKIEGEWCDATGRHAGTVYLNGEWLSEASKLEQVLSAAAAAAVARRPAASPGLWFAKVEPSATTIWAKFPGVDPNKEEVEINVRQTVFYPSKPGISYITVRGFELRQAATPWAGAMSEQIGLIGTHWSKGWVIENNHIHHSMCTGVTLGRYELAKAEFPPASAKGFVKSVELALRDGWSKEKIGGHIVRNNHIHHCGQTGIVGSLGCAFSKIIGNEIHDINMQRIWGGAEMAGIKFHGGIDVVVSGNHIYRCGEYGGLWLDWMAQGPLITDNLFHDNHGSDLFLEVNHGPFLVANNLFLSPVMQGFGWGGSQGGAYAHNLISGRIANFHGDGRGTQVMKPHSTELIALKANPVGDVRWYNNILANGEKFGAYDNATMPVTASGNVFAKGATPSKYDKEALLKPDFDTGAKLTRKDDGWYLELNTDVKWAAEQKRAFVATELLGKAIIPDQEFTNPDGSPLKIDTDYSGNPRNPQNPFPGPFETVKDGKQEIKVWPRRQLIMQGRTE
ncbi:MAG: right-handed parallel beta-helix repeat-containing protein [Kiritimatiellaeota bacterium]|nr:right-handed parallel beta-helix repeat-containing protein [Kiritimatiellota bacterium]